MGYNIPAAHLKSVFKYREVEGYREQSLICRGNDPYVQMVQSLGRILKEMGYKGLLLFFDEAESIAQGRLGHRAKSYHLLDQFFHSKGSVFPVFAFTDDFFDKVNHEPYDDDQRNFSKELCRGLAGFKYSASCKTFLLMDGNLCWTVSCNSILKLIKSPFPLK